MSITECYSCTLCNSADEVLDKGFGCPWVFVNFAASLAFFA